MSKHTPGPWMAIKRMPRVVNIEVERRGLRSVIARIYDDELCPEHGGSYEANAALIASAPDLAEENERLKNALRELHDCLAAYPIIMEIDRWLAITHQALEGKRVKGESRK